MLAKPFLGMANITNKIETGWTQVVQYKNSYFRGLSRSVQDVREQCLAIPIFANHRAGVLEMEIVGEEKIDIAVVLADKQRISGKAEVIR